MEDDYNPDGFGPYPRMPRASALDRLVTRRSDALVAALPAALDGEVASVHAARVASRRLREVLPVLRGHRDTGQLRWLRRHIRAITRALGPVRELDVAVGLVDERAAAQGASRLATAALREALVTERLRRREEMLRVLTRRHVGEVTRHLAALGSGGDETPGAESALVRSRRRVEARAGRLQHAILEAGALYVPARLHEVRIAAKQLRYAAEVEHELRRRRPGVALARLKAVQEVLGDQHDLVIVLEHARAVPEASRSRRAAAALEKFITALDLDARRCHAKYMAARDRLVAAAETLAASPRARRRPTR